MTLGYFEGYSILAKKKESMDKGNYIFLAILNDLSLLLKIFWPTLGQNFI